MTALVSIDPEWGEFRRYERHCRTGKLVLMHHAAIDPATWADVRAGNMIFDGDSIFQFRLNPPDETRVRA
jgi:hypothetical protein